MSEGTRTAMESVQEIVQEGVPPADLGFSWDFWYPAMRSTEIIVRNARGSGIQ